jgi:hypothetical protein
MKVRVDRCSLKTFWYAGRVGEVFSVIPSRFPDSWAVRDQRAFLLLKKDCRPVRSVAKVKAHNRPSMPVRCYSCGSVVDVKDDCICRRCANRKSRRA